MGIRTNVFKYLLTNYWDEALAALILLILALFLLGYDWFGLNGYVSTLLALVGGLVLAVVGFVVATMVMPLVLMVLGFATALLAAVAAAWALVFTALIAPLLAFVVGTIVLPIVALVTGLISTLTAWLAGTWLGTLLMPVINTVSPLLVKFGPWVAAFRHSEWALTKVNQLRSKFGLDKLTSLRFDSKRTPKRPSKRNPRRR